MHWPWRYGVNKTSPFLHFLTAKGGTKTIAHLPIAEGSSFRNLGAFTIVNFGRRKKDLIQVGSEFSP
jgi:hypothetical protein